MIKLYDIVRVYVGGTVDIPQIGLANGVCEWYEGDTLGVLTDSWRGSIRNSVDISVSGNEQKYQGFSIEILKTALVEATLKNNGLSLTGSRIEVLETDGVTESMLYRGVVRTLAEEGNNVVVQISHVANYYQTHLSPRVGDSYSPMVYGDSVRAKLTYAAGSTDENTTIGNGLIPAFKVYTQDEDSIELTSVYDESIVTRQDVIDFSGFGGATKNFIASSENDLVLFTGSAIFSISQEGKTYWGAKFGIRPTNARDEYGEPFIPTDKTCILNVATADKYHYPYGSIVDFDKLEYEQDGVFYDFPNYVDSIEYFSDRIEILDADNKGDSFVAPSGYSGVDTTRTLETVVPTLAYYGDGVFYQDSEITIDSVEVTQGDELAKRGSNKAVNVRIKGTNNTNTGFPYSIYTSFLYPVKFDRSDIPEDLYATRFCRSLSVTGTIERQQGDPSVLVQTISGTTPYSHISQVVSGVYSDNLLPEVVANDNTNIRYRWENQHNLLGKEINIFDSSEIEDYEKVAGVNIVPVLRVGVFPGSFDVIVAMKCFCCRTVSYNTSNLYITTTGMVDSNGVAITDTATAYESVLRLQNYETSGISTPSLGWGLEYPADDISGVVDSTISVPAIPLSYNANSVNTKDVKYDLLKYTFGIGFINSDGKESYKSVLSMYEQGGVLFNKFKISGSPSVVAIDPTKVFSDVGVTYSGGTISITNTEQDIWDSSGSYVSGVPDSVLARKLWQCGNIIYRTYGMKNEYPQKLGDVRGIKNESDAVEHIFNQYKLAGAVVSGDEVVLYNRYKVRFRTSREYTYGLGLGIGSSITFSYPNIATSDTGIITGYEVDKEVVTITAECVGEIIDTTTEFTIIESGAQADNIVESGNREINYVEA